MFPDFSTSGLPDSGPPHGPPPQNEGQRTNLCRRNLEWAAAERGDSRNHFGCQVRFRRSTVTRSCRLPSSRVKTLGPRASTRYGPSYNGESGGPGALRLMSTKSAEERAGGGVDAGGGPLRGLVGKLTGGRRRFSKKLAAGGSAVSRSSPGRAKGTP